MQATEQTNPIVELDVVDLKKMEELKVIDHSELKIDTFHLKCQKCGEPYAFQYDFRFFCLNMKCPMITSKIILEPNLASIIKLSLFMILSLNQKVTTEIEMRMYHESQKRIDDTLLDLDRSTQDRLTKMDKTLNQLTQILENILKRTTKIEGDLSGRTRTKPK